VFPGKDAAAAGAIFSLRDRTRSPPPVDTFQTHFSPRLNSINLERISSPSLLSGRERGAPVVVGAALTSSPSACIRALTLLSDGGNGRLHRLRWQRRQRRYLSHGAMEPDLGGAFFSLTEASPLFIRPFRRKVAATILGEILPSSRSLCLRLPNRQTHHPSRLPVGRRPAAGQNTPVRRPGAGAEGRGGESRAKNRSGRHRRHSGRRRCPPFFPLLSS
jgi:hypothetical protein